MQVLMQTLQNEPPTLDRHSKKKFTRTFKDMIDSCLQKDPTKRLSAEKLLQHQFFKHAKKQQWLVDNIVKQVPGVVERPQKDVKKRQEEM